MNKQIDKIKSLRLFVLKQIEGLSITQLNKIPHGFSNNIIWNLGHLLSAMQIICYKRAALPPAISDEYVSPFLPTTKPGKLIGIKEIDVIKELLISSVNTLQKGYEQNIFTNYTPSPNILNVYSISLTTIDDAIDFLLYHEGFHTGGILAIKKLI